MSELSDRCEVCLGECNPLSARVFPCLYHCKRMLCIKHLSEHDKYIDKQIQLQKQLENLWNNYISIFNEDKIQEEFHKLKTKLDYHQRLKKYIERLLVINQFPDSLENDDKFQTAIDTIQTAIEQENQSQFTIDDIDPHNEFNINEEDNQQTIDHESLSTSAYSNNDSETMDSFPSALDTNGNSPSTDLQNDDYHHTTEPDTYQNSTDVESEDNRMEDSSLKDDNNITPRRTIAASRLRGYCPLTQDGVFGISCRVHGIQLCSKSNGNKRTYRLHEHFRRVHHLTPFASLTLARAVHVGQDPMTKQLFDNNHIILNIDELRTVNCPINQPFKNHPSLQFFNSPCDTIKQVRHLKDHLKRVHRFTTKAANLIVKAVKIDAPIHELKFPQWIDIIEDD